MRHAITALILAAMTMTAVAGVQADEAKPNKIHAEGDFKRTAKQMTTCTAALMKFNHPELHFFHGAAGDWVIVSGGVASDITASTWSLAAKDAGDQASQVKLLKTGATDAELDEVWGSVKACETQK